MVKYIYTFFIFSAALFASGQELPTKMKFDSVQFSNNGQRAIIFSGKKTALYDLNKDEYLLKPTKNKICYISGFGQNWNLEVYLVDAKDSKSFFVIANDSSSLELISYSEDLQLSFCSPEILQDEHYLYVSFQGSNWNVSDMEITEDICGQWNFTSNIELVNEHYLLVNESEDWEIQYFYDEINDLYETRIDTGYFKSGMMDLESGVWSIPPIYAECSKINDYVFCRKYAGFIDGSEDYYSEILYSYDLYVVSDEGTSMIKSGFNELDTETLAKVLNVDEVIKTGDELVYKTIDSTGQSLIFFGLNWFHYASETQHYFNYYHLLKQAHDFVQYRYDYGIVNVFDADNPFTSYNLRDVLLDNGLYIIECKEFANSTNHLFFEQFYNGEIHIDNGENVSVINFNNEEEPTLVHLEDANEMLYHQYGLELWNDSLILVTNFMYDILSEYPLMSLEWPGEDSIDFEGNFVYPPAIPGFEKTGIFDFKNNVWLIKPIHRQILKVHGGFLITDVLRESVNNNDTAEVYSLVSNNGETIFSNKSYSEVNNNHDLLKLTIDEFKVDSLFRAPQGYSSHSANTNNSTYYFRTNNQLGVFDPYYQKFYYPKDLFVSDFVHVNPDLDYMFYLENDSIYLEFENFKKGVSQGAGSIEFNIVDNLGSLEAYQILLIEKADTTIIENNYRSGYKESPHIRNKIHFSNNRLIVNENGTSTTYVEENYTALYDESYYEIIIERENSSVWEKINEAWIKMTPYYASVVEIPNGYLVKTGDYFYGYPWLDDAYYEKSTENVKIIGRYLLLDENYQAIQFLDYYDFEYIEDLGFGLKIKTDNGFFFADYTGHAITNDEWDEFQLKDGKLKAIKKDFYPLDEYGDYQYDENGEQIIFPGTIEYFDLPD